MLLSQRGFAATKPIRHLLVSRRHLIASTASAATLSPGGASLAMGSAVYVETQVRSGGFWASMRTWGKKDAATLGALTLF